MSVLVVVSVYLAMASMVSMMGSAQPDCTNPDAQVLVLGGEFTAIGAAKTLSERGIDDYLIIEARDVIGGRAQSVKFGGATVELGPQLIQRVDLDPTIPEEMQHPFLPFIRRCNITLRDVPLGGLGVRTYTSEGVDITNSPEIRSANQRYLAALSNTGTLANNLPDNVDIPFSQALSFGGWRPRTPLEEHVEYINWDLPFTEPTDTGSYRNILEINAESEVNAYGDNAADYVVTDSDRGYEGLVQCIADEFLEEYDPRLLLNSFVSVVNWSDECVCISVTQNGEDRQYCAPYAILTFGVGVLQSDVVRFVPELPLAKRIALNEEKRSYLVKVYALFNETFWDTDVDYIAHFDPDRGRYYYPAFTPWGAYFPERPPILEAYLTYDEAFRVRNQDEELTRGEINQVLRNIYGDRASDAVDIIINDFATNPLFFGNVASASPGFSRNTLEVLSQPLGRLYLAGEGFTFTQRYSMHGAFLHGIETGNRVADELLVAPPQVIFINNTPRIDGNNVTAEFRISMPVESVQCSISAGERIDCSSGQITFSNLQDGSHQLKVIARNFATNERAVGNRNLFISSDPHCAVHLINRGVTVYHDNARVEFDSSGLPVSGFSCRVESRTISPCNNPLQLRDLSPGRHVVRITPICDEGQSIRRGLSVFIP